MRVRIVRSSGAEYWYSNRIGEEFEVRLAGSKYCVIKLETNSSISLIDKEDCIIIPKEEKMSKNCIIIDGKEIQLSEETVKEIKEKLGLEKDELEWIPEDKYWYIDNVELTEKEFNEQIRNR